MPQRFKNLQVIDHPLVQDRLSRIRRKETNTEDFRRLLKEIAMLMAFDVTRHLKITTREIETPMGNMNAPVLAHQEPVIIPILRAGLGLSDGLKEVLGAASFGHIGVYRNEETKRPVEYLVRLPKDIQQRDIILVDPMLATGYSAKYALDILAKEGVSPSQIRFMVLVAAPEGIELLQKEHPEIKIFTAALDSHLDKNSFIVPGLGDAGDRIFGTV
ncbi:MAG: uracil phosphoribosyltransferase [Alphaproteobacteria bacterium]|nr:uracil phosphoribosyltransferase [Alphaproteobacteria bacterium]